MSGNKKKPDFAVKILFKLTVKKVKKLIKFSNILTHFAYLITIGRKMIYHFTYYSCQCYEQEKYGGVFYVGYVN